MQTVAFNGVDYDPRMDGATHINIYTGAATRLGQWLSNFTKGEVVTSFGTFASMEAVYHYLKITRTYAIHKLELHSDIEAELEELKSLYGKAAQDKGRKIKVQVRQKGLYTYEVPDEVFNALFEEAMVYKLKSNPTHCEDLKELMGDGLPLLHYYILSKTIVHKAHFDWLPNRIEAALQYCY